MGRALVAMGSGAASELSYKGRESFHQQKGKGKQDSEKKVGFKVPGPEFESQLFTCYLEQVIQPLWGSVSTSVKGRDWISGLTSEVPLSSRSVIL